WMSQFFDLQEAVICSICLAYFNDPVILKCGHNFCRACITQYCKESKTSPSYSCPQCREPFQEGEFHPNWQLRNIVDIAKNIPEPRGKKACEEHEELLKLFCEVDQTPICVVCRESRSHKEHSMVPIEEAALDYKVRISMLEQFRTEPSETYKTNNLIKMGGGIAQWFEHWPAKPRVLSSILEGATWGSGAKITRSSPVQGKIQVGAGNSTSSSSYSFLLIVAGWRMQGLLLTQTEWTITRSLVVP
uniref:Uncharacterized protein n=1 Tax=Terrapene triunguis TaxID=2587831 RepID=A0A674JZX4_9SAUR